MSFSRRSSQPRDRTQVSYIADKYFTDSYEGNLQAHFRHIFESSNPHQQLITFGETRCTDRLSNLPKLTQIVSNKTYQAKS